MAWIEVHQSLPTHRKTKKLARELGFKGPGGIAQAVGHLIMLWLWSVDNAPDGSLSQIDPHDVADAAGWAKEPDRFIRALLESGYLDPDLSIHDWSDYIESLITQREARKAGNRERQKRFRDKKRYTEIVTSNERNEDDSVTNANITRYGNDVSRVTDNACNADDSVTSRVTDNARNGTTVPNPTIPNHTTTTTVVDARAYAREDGGRGCSDDITDGDAVNLNLAVSEIEGAITGIGMPFAGADFETANALLADYPLAWILAAVQQAAEGPDTRSWRYIKGVLRNWRERGGMEDTGGRKTSAPAVGDRDSQGRVWDGARWVQL